MTLTMSYFYSLIGVPGFVAAGFRHFRSLRTLKRDYGWIPTLLEEAENERMHLLVCLSQFQAGFVTRAFVISLQAIMVPALMAVYLVHPKSLVSSNDHLFYTIKFIFDYYTYVFLL